MFRPRDELRPAADRSEARDRARAGGTALGPRRVRQLRRRRALLRPGPRAALREHGSGWTMHPAECARLPAWRITPRTYPFTYDDRRRCPICCARSSGTIPTRSARSTAGRAAIRPRTGPTGHAAMLLGTMTPRDPARASPMSRVTRRARRTPIETLKLRQRHLPRLRAADDGGGALARPRRAVRLRLPLRARRRSARPARRRQHPCLGAGLPARRRLGRVRSDQRHRRQSRPDPRRGRARSAPGRAAHPAPGRAFPRTISA